MRNSRRRNEIRAASTRWYATERRGRDATSRAYPDHTKMRRAMNLGQIRRFLWEIETGDVVVTPMKKREHLLVGLVDSPNYYEITPECPYGHRKSVRWLEEPILRSSLSVPIQNILLTRLTVFMVRPPDELLRAAGEEAPTPELTERAEEEASAAVLRRLLELDADEFEILVAELLKALGFEAEKVGRTGDGGVDVEGTLAVHNFAAVDLKVQVKRYKLGNIVGHNAIKELRASVPDNAQAALVTTSGYTKKAREEALREGFKRIGLIDGQQLVDILTEEYDRLPQEVREELGLRRVLVAD